MAGASSIRRWRSDAGAILIQVAVALLAFTMLSAFVIDYGEQLISRVQIQTAADAAALAAATALGFDSYSDRSDTGPAKTAARAVAAKNLVWKEEASATLADIEFPVCADTYAAGASGSPILACTQVTAYRSAARSNPIPTSVAQLMGVSSFGVAATAIAESKDANATDCLKPIAIPDKWTEHYPVNPGTWSASSTFDRWNPANPTVLLPPSTRDSYIPPDQLGAGTGLTMTVAFGAQVTLQPGSLSSPISTISPWLYLPVQIPGSTFGPNDVLSNTRSCAGARVAIGDRLNIPIGGVGPSAALIGQGLLDLYNRDPGAHWNAATQRVEGSCAELLLGRCASMSPRTIALAVYNPTDLAEASHAGGATSVLVTNIVGFFIDSVAGENATGHITRHPGLIQSTAITLYDASAFLRASLLVQ